MTKVIVEFGVNQLTLEKRLYVAGLVTESDDRNVRVGDDVTARGKQCNAVLSQCRERCRVTAECTVTENEGRQKWLATAVKVLNVSPMETIISRTNEIHVEMLTTAITRHLEDDKTLKVNLIKEGIDPSTPAGKIAYDAKISQKKSELFELGIEYLVNDLTNGRERMITKLLNVFKNSDK